MNALPPTGRIAAGLLTVALLLGACSSAAAPSTQPSTPPSANSTEPSPDSPVTAPPSDGVGQVPAPGGKFVVPKPGQLDIHPVPADSLAARVDGSTIIVTATWTSGVEPCNVLDSIEVAQGSDTYTITLREGHGPEEIACIAIAEQHKTEFEIPNVAAGTYTIADSGGLAAPIRVTVN
jgi:ABC-type transport system substrate-binding protein